MSVNAPPNIPQKISASKFAALIKCRRNKLNFTQKQFYHHIFGENSNNKKPEGLISQIECARYGIVQIDTFNAYHEVLSFSQLEISKLAHGDRDAGIKLDDPYIRDHLFQYKLGLIPAVRLWGESSLCVRPSDLELLYTHNHIRPRPHNQLGYAAYCSEREAAAKKEGRSFFNGPNVKLDFINQSTRNDQWVGHERAVLELRLGPVSWYEYSYLNVRDLASRTGGKLSPEYLESIGWRNLVRNHNVDQSTLANIMSTATTIVTSDGYVTYSHRSGRTDTSPWYFTSAVAENVNRYKDDCSQSTPHRAVRDRDRSFKAPHDYEPEGTPSPVAAVLRGIEEEISPGLDLTGWETRVRITGVSFDLLDGHPDFLSMILVPYTIDALLNIRRTDPGTDRREGELLACRCSFDDLETVRVLKSENWIASGKASLVRALEVFDRHARDGTAFDKTFAGFVNGEI